MLLNKNKTFTGTVALWVALFLWGMHSPIGRYLAVKGIPTSGIMAARLWTGSIIFWSFLLITKKLDLAFLKGNFKKIALLSFTGIYLNLLTFHWGMKYIPATLVMLLENLAPFLVILLVWLIDKKKPSLIEACCQCIGFAGLLIIIAGKGGFQGDWSNFLLGIALEIIAGVTWAIYSYFSGRWLNTIIFQQDSDARFFPCLNFICVLLTISAVIATPQFLSFNHVSIELSDCLFILFIGVFQTGLAFMLWNYALGTLPLATVSTCFYMTVVFTCINEMLFLDLKPSWILLEGALLILGSALMLTYAKNRSEKTINKPNLSG